MNFLTTKLDGVIVVEPVVHRDDRGFFMETFHAEKYAAGGIDAVFVQDNHSRSTRGTLRGLHAQWRRPQGKLLRCVKGRIFDVAVDMRRGSPTWAQWVGVELSDEDFKQIYVPPSFLHGFLVLSEVAEVEYKCTDVYDQGGELGVLWSDPEIGIDWPLSDPLLSAKDAASPTLGAVDPDLLPVFQAP